jgi:RNA polymerase sigma-70 factor (ECF subfamily)
MSDEHDFVTLMERVRARDEAAARELLRRYEPVLRRAIRVRLLNPRLGRVLDPADVCQSVFGSFFRRAGLGQFVVNTPEQLVQLLVSMARNKVADFVRKEQAGRRDYRRTEEADSALDRAAAGGGSPSDQVAEEEIRREALRRLSEEERRLVDQRGAGREWAEIAAEHNESPDALRKRLARALNRVARELGLEALSDD